MSNTRPSPQHTNTNDLGVYDCSHCPGVVRGLFSLFFLVREFGDSYKIEYAFLTPTIRFGSLPMLKKYYNVTAVKVK